MSAATETGSQPGPFGSARMAGSSIAVREAQRAFWGRREDAAPSMLHEVARAIEP